MPKVFTKVARKEYKCSLTGKTIKPGDTYYEFSPYKQSARKCSRYPRQSELTQGKMSGAYRVQEIMEDYKLEGSEIPANMLQEAKEDCSSWADEIREVANEYEESLNNMPDSLQQSSKGEEIQEKIDALNEWADEVENCLETVDEYEEPEQDEEIEKSDNLTHEERVQGAIADHQDKILEAIRDTASNLSI